jgi:hypothetical protein
MEGQLAAWVETDYLSLIFVIGPGHVFPGPIQPFLIFRKTQF